MESPRKKLKVVQEPESDLRTSTPLPIEKNLPAEDCSISRIQLNGTPQVRKRIEYNGTITPKRVSILSLTNLLESSSSSLAKTLQEDDEDVIDYDAFLQSCKIQRKGDAWKRYKPIGEEGSLYHQITSNPQGAEELAKWFVHYCKNKPVIVGTYILHRLFFDCAGYQKFDVKRYYSTFPPDLKQIMAKTNNDRFTNQMLATTKFLFADEVNLAKILKYGIFNFLQKMIVAAHEESILHGPIFSGFLKLLITMSKEAAYRNLTYTAFIFVIKMLTGICMVKEKISDARTHAKQNVSLDNYINILYMCFTTVCQIEDSDLAALKIACLNELIIWIQYSARVFVDHYSCTNILKQLLCNESSQLVRLAALNSCMKLIQDEKLVSYLNDGPIEILISQIYLRICDSDLSVQIRAIEVYTAMVPYYSDAISKMSLFDNIIEALYHEDYTMGSAAGKCLIDICNQGKDDEFSLLLYLSQIAKKFHPDKKSLLVESVFDHTNVLQNWPLIVEIFWNIERDVSDEVKSSLSELLLESVHVTLSGGFSKVRTSSKPARSVDPANNKIIADEIYPYLKRIIGLNRHENVMRNFFKTVVKIAPEYLTSEHCKVVNEVIKLFMKFFVMWDDSETLTALIDYLLYVHQYLPAINSTSKYIIEDLKKYISEKLYKSFKNKDNTTLIAAKKTHVVFQKIDLNEHLEWSKLLFAWAVIESNAEFTSHILASCHWSLMWKLSTLKTPELKTLQNKSELNKEITLISKMSTQFFNNCYEILGLDKNMKFKAFERICETSEGFCLELENISKQIRALEQLKPTIKDDKLKSEMMDVFELATEQRNRSETERCLSYIMSIHRMVSLAVLPVECLSMVFKHFDEYYDIYGERMVAILTSIREKNKNWIPQLLLNSITILYEDILRKRGVVDIKTKEAKKILALSRRFRELKKIMTPKIAAKMLMFAINYASVTKYYDFLIFVRTFTDELQRYPADCKEILKTVRNKLPSAAKNDYVRYFLLHLRKTSAAGSVEYATENTRKSTTVRPRRGKQLVQKTPSQSSTETGSSDKTSIHDTSSDVPAISVLNL